MKEIKLRSIFGPNIRNCTKMKVKVSFIRDFSGNLDYVYENEYNIDSMESIICVSEEELPDKISDILKDAKENFLSYCEESDLYDLEEEYPRTIDNIYDNHTISMDMTFPVEAIETMRLEIKLLDKRNPLTDYFKDESYVLVPELVKWIRYRIIYDEVKIAFYGMLHIKKKESKKFDFFTNIVDFTTEDDDIKFNINDIVMNRRTGNRYIVTDIPDFKGVYWSSSYGMIPLDGEKIFDPTMESFLLERRLGDE